MARRHTKLQEDTLSHLIRIMQENPEMSQRELVEVAGGINYVLQARIDKGLVKLGNSTAAEEKRRYA